MRGEQGAGSGIPHTRGDGPEIIQLAECQERVYPTRVGMNREQSLSGAPKSYSGIRDLQMPKVLIEILEEHRARFETQKGFRPSQHICGGLRLLRDTTIENRNNKYTSLAGLRPIRIHDFRHSHISMLANAGVNIQEVARRLEHSDVKMTWNIYSHMYPKDNERAAQVLDDLARAGEDED